MTLLFRNMFLPFVVIRGLTLLMNEPACRCQGTRHYFGYSESGKMGAAVARGRLLLWGHSSGRCASPAWTANRPRTSRRRWTPAHHSPRCPPTFCGSWALRPRASAGFLLADGRRVDGQARVSCWPTDGASRWITDRGCRSQTSFSPPSSCPVWDQELRYSWAAELESVDGGDS